MNCVCYYDSPIGWLRLEDNGQALIGLEFVKQRAEADDQKPSVIAVKAKQELEEYFAGKREVFTVPLAPKGTPFMVKVWSALCTIPYGELRAYSEIAVQVGVPKGARAIGLANNHNPIPIIIPCHRVISKDGTLGGYAGGLALKRKLLSLEEALTSIKE